MAAATSHAMKCLLTCIVRFILDFRAKQLKFANILEPPSGFKTVWKMCSMYMSGNRISSAIGFAALVIVAVGLGIMFWIYPYAFDDFSYMRFLRIDEGGLPDSFDMGAFSSNLGYRIYNDNLRLANITAIFGLAMPKWLIGFTSGILFSLALWLIAKAMDLNERHPLRMAPMALAAMAFMPWWDGIAAVAYQLSYVWPTAMMALVLWLFFSHKSLHWVIAVLIGLIFGAWHEGFSAPVLFGLGLCWICWRRFRTPWRTALLVSMAVGVVFLLSVPGMWAKVGVKPDLFSPYYIWRTALALTPVWLALVLWLIAYAVKRVKMTPLWLTFISIAFVSVVMKFMQDDFRVAWLGIFVGSISLAWLACLLASGWSRTLKICLSSLCLAAVAVHLIAADSEAFRERSLLGQVVGYLRNDSPERGPLYLKGLKSFSNAPLLAWGKPLQSMWRWPNFERYYHLPEGSVDQVALVPVELLQFDPAQAKTIGENTWLTDDGYIVTDDLTIADWPMTEGEVHTPLFDEKVCFIFSPFVSARTGKPYVHVFPTLAPPWVRPVRSIDYHTPNAL